MFSSMAFSIDVFIMSSSDILPYSTCIEGIKGSLTEYSLQLLNIEEDLERGRKILLKIRKKNPKVIITVGPQAAFVLSKEQYFSPRIFCMILNPVKLLGQNRVYPGVSLNIPPHFQIEKIKDAFPEKKRVGIFFGPERNQATVEVFSQEGNKLGIEIVKFPISSAKDISAIINSKEFSIDVLLIIPDEQLGSTKIVEYVIKESLRRKVPVVGYNSWFAKNGALLSFVIDYRDVGMQTGKLAKKMLLEEGPLPDIGIVPPEKIKTSVDLKTAKKLGVKISPAIIQQAHEVIK